MIYILYIIRKKDMKGLLYSAFFIVSKFTENINPNISFLYVFYYNIICVCIEGLGLGNLHKKKKKP